MPSVDHLVISCLDFRVRPRVAAWIDEELGGAADLLSFAGASRALVDPALSQACLIQVLTACRNHSVRTVHLIDHLDCAAFGGSAAYGGPDREASEHRRALELAASTLRPLLRTIDPDCELRLYLLA